MVAIRQHGEDMNFDKVFDEEFAPHLAALYNFAYSFTFNEHDANDLVQETMLKAYKAIRLYEQGTNAKAWLFRILKNTYINEYRSKARRPNSVELDDARTVADVEANGGQGAYVGMDFSSISYRDVLGDEITKAVDTMPEDFRIVFLLCDLEDFSYEEISKIMDIPIGTVRSRLHRGRLALKTHLKVYAESMGFYTE
jgi:RNA polymerase sigma factor (sigma-70 family)